MAKVEQKLSPWEMFMVAVKQRQQTVAELFRELDYKPGAGVTAYARTAAFIHEDEVGLDEEVWALARKRRNKVAEMKDVIALAEAVTASTVELHRWAYGNQQLGAGELLVEVVQRRAPLFLRLQELQKT